jgi:Ca2+-binding RTX toxin-like protein
VTVYNLDGDYRLVFSVDDRTSGGGRATVYIDNLTVTTPATPGWVETVTTPHEINVADLIWTSVAPISGEINLANYITGTEATTLSIAGSPSDANGVITVIGIYGTLTFYTEAYDGHVAGSYVYDPIDTLTAGGQETFNIALNQMDGDSATIALTVNTVGSLLHDGDTSSVYVVQHGNYDASASDHGEYIFGDDTGLQLTGSSHNDYIQGGAGSDTLTGGAGSDLLIGGGGSDILVGGAGDDVLTGGLGSDTFKYQAGDLDSTAVHGDVITDFKVDTIANGGDVLDISGVLPAGLSETDLKDGGYLKFEYVSGDAGTTVVKLSIDADGSAVGGSVYTPLATITMTGAGTIDPTAIMNQLLANQEIKF